MLVNRQNMNISAYKSLPVSAKRESLVAQGCDTVRRLATSQQHTYNTYIYIAAIYTKYSFGGKDNKKESVVMSESIGWLSTYLTHFSAVQRFTKPQYLIFGVLGNES